MATVAAVIPHWNRRELLVALLESLRAQKPPFDEIIVADNGSSDDSAEVAERAGARVLRLGHNFGFAAAVNRGIEAARTDWVAILNNDVTLEPDWLRALLFAVGQRPIDLLVDLSNFVMLAQGAFCSDLPLTSSSPLPR
jgi:GT2 family glycosyltransferase